MNNTIRKLAGTGLILLGGIVTTSAQAIPQTELDVLTKFYYSTNGDIWRIPKRWLIEGGADPCLWHGITCKSINGEDHVVAIKLDMDLFNRNPLYCFTKRDPITQVCPLPDFNPLTYLERLDLRGNIWSSRWDLTGPFPNISGLSALSYVDLGGHDFYGELPDLSGLSSLQYFDISYNELSGSLPAPPSLLMKSHGAIICPNHFNISTDPNDFWLNLGWSIATNPFWSDNPNPWWNNRVDTFGTPACTAQ